MANNELRERIRAEAMEEARNEQEKEIRTARKLRRFQIATAVLGILLFLAVVSAAQFLKGGSWYEYREDIGRFVLLLAGCLLSAFMLAAGLTYGLWNYLRSMRKIHKRYSPPLSKHRTGS